MVAPSGLLPLSLGTEPNDEIMKPYRLVRTPRGWKAFDMVFKSKLGAPLRETLHQAIKNKVNNKVTSFDAKQLALFVHIRDRLIALLVNEQDIVAELAEHCDPDNGVDQYLYLQNKFIGATIAKTVTVFETIINTTFNGEIVDQCRRIVSDNNTMIERLPDVLLVTLIICKLPDNFHTMKTMLINGNTFPTPSELIDIIENNVAFEKSAMAAPFVRPSTFAISTRPCINCNKIGHAANKCPQPKATCSVCGNLGHMAAHCLVSVDTPPPTWMTEAQKNNLIERRAIYKAGKATAAAAAPTPPPASTMSMTARGYTTGMDESTLYSPFII
jgi:hypothetical protein